MLENLAGHLTQWGVTPVAAQVLARLAVLLTAWVTFALARMLVRRVFQRLIRRSRIRWDDVLVEHRVLERLTHLVPALVIYHAGPLVFSQMAGVIRTAATVYLIGVGLRVADAALNVLYDFLKAWDEAGRIPVEGLVQALKIAAYVAAGILILGAVLEKPPWYFLSGLGAMTAVVLLIFRDPILGFVAGIQLTANDMVKVGDWIEMPKYDADGDVIDVSLTTVKVQNWDKTITNVPTYALISNSFENWRGMKESGGRRIKRALHLDMTSVRFCDQDLIERLGRIQLLRDYIGRKQRELAEHNRERGVDDSTLVNGRRMTNLGTFRAYIDAYLRNHPRIHQDMTFLVRQLSPTQHGLPLELEVYVFSSDQVWANYEAIKADIFDHLLAVVPEFDLRVFQNPLGADLRELATPWDGDQKNRAKDGSPAVN